MSEFKLISAILRGHWLMDDSWVNDHLPMIERMISGEKVSFAPEESRTMALDPELTTYHYRDGWKNAVAGSIAFYDLRGPIMHYGYCGDGSHEMLQAFREAESNQNIVAHFFLADTPGGQVQGTKEFADEIAKSKKNTATLINGGMLCSGGMWIASATDAIYATSDLVQVGSIGAQMSFSDYSKQDEMNGVKRFIIRARPSFDKNVLIERAVKGNEQALKELEDEITVMGESIISAVKQNRGERLVGEGWDTGKVFYAPKAIELGLIDGIASQEEVIAKLRFTNQNLKKSKSNMNKFLNVAALAGNSSVTQEQLDLANADLTAAGIMGHTIVEQSVIDEGARVTEELATANASLTKANSTIATQVTEIAALQGKVTTLEGVIAKRAVGDNGSATKADATKVAEIQPAGAEKKVAAHNKAADAGFFGV